MGDPSTGSQDNNIGKLATKKGTGMPVPNNWLYNRF